MKAIVRFHYGKTIYEIGDDVPEEVIKKYPQLVGVVYETEKKNITEKDVKEQNVEHKEEYRFSPMQKKRK